MIITLIEHWSEARHIHLRRVNWYVADLLLGHPDADVLPILLVTDRSAGDIAEPG